MCDVDQAIGVGGAMTNRSRARQIEVREEFSYGEIT